MLKALNPHIDDDFSENKAKNAPWIHTKENYLTRPFNFYSNPYLEFDKCRFYPRINNLLDVIFWHKDCSKSN